MRTIYIALDALMSFFLGLVALILVGWVLYVTLDIGKQPLTAATVLNKPVGNNWLARGIEDMSLAGATVINSGIVRAAVNGREGYIEIPYVGWLLLPWEPQVRKDVQWPPPDVVTTRQ